MAVPQVNPFGKARRPWRRNHTRAKLCEDADQAGTGRRPESSTPGALLDLEAIEVNIFRGVSPDEKRQRVFGGQVAGQALVAAARTVDPGTASVNSLHAYFLRPGDPTIPILYEVDRIRDGRSFTTRRVVAIQHGKAIFNLPASFHARSPGSTSSCRCPTMPSARQRCRRSRSGGRPTPRSWASGTTGRGRSTPATSTGRPRIARSHFRRTSGCGCGPTARLPDDPILHTCVLTYASDMTLLDTTLLPHGGKVRGAA